MDEFGTEKIDPLGGFFEQFLYICVIFLTNCSEIVTYVL